MSYRIEYDGRVGKYEVRQERNFLPGVIAGVGLTIVLIFCFWPGAGEGLRSFLIPGEDAVTVQAFSAMTDDLRSGAGLWDAVEGFCRTVIHGQ